MKKIALVFLVGLLTIACQNQNNNFKPYKDAQGNEIIDQFNNVSVYYNNGGNKRNSASDGYNLGLKWQCVEFVKRYYYVHFNHKMPNAFGHAKDFYNHNLKDGQINKGRNLIQFSNNSKSKPKVNDLIIMDGHVFNKFGHIAVISKVTDTKIEIVQQNVGRQTRATYNLYQKNGLWVIKNDLTLGRLRVK